MLLQLRRHELKEVEREGDGQSAGVRSVEACRGTRGAPPDERVAAPKFDVAEGIVGGDAHVPYPDRRDDLTRETDGADVAGRVVDDREADDGELVHERLVHVD